jgi:hypothetical protein
MRPEYLVRTDPGAMPYVSALSRRQPGAYIGSKSILFRSATRGPGDDAIEPGAARIDFVGRGSWNHSCTATIQTSLFGKVMAPVAHPSKDERIPGRTSMNPCPLDYTITPQFAAAAMVKQT